MQAYVDNNKQSPLHQNALQNLMKNTSMGQKQQKRANAVPGTAQTTNSVSSKNLDKVLLNANVPNLAKDAVTIGRDYEITKEDALNRLNRPIYKMDDSVESGLSVIEQDLEKGISNEVDFSFANMDLANFGPDSVGQDVDYIASRYAAMQERINAEFTGEERSANLNKLDEMLNTAKEKLAQSFSDEMAGFFENTGVSGDKDNIYQSVLSAVDQKVAQYTDFIKENKAYAHIGTGEEWLKKDSAFMASELRKAMDSSETSPKTAIDADGYTLDEMEKLYTFAKELESYSDYASNPAKAILTGNHTEEALGMKLAELSLKGMVFNEKADVSDKVKKIVKESIQNFISSTIEAEQAHMDKWSSLQIQATNKSASQGAYSASDLEKEIQKIRKAHTAVDKDAIFAVIDKVTSSYQKSGDAGKALIDGAVFAKDSFSHKAQSKEYNGITRYDDGERHWDSFFVKGEQVDGYQRKETGLENMENSWNEFMGKVTDDSSVFFNSSNYSAMA